MRKECSVLSPLDRKTVRDKAFQQSSEHQRCPLSYWQLESATGTVDERTNSTRRSLFRPANPACLAVSVHIAVLDTAFLHSGETDLYTFLLNARQPMQREEYIV